MQCRISMYWYSSQQLTTMVSSGFSCFRQPEVSRSLLSHVGPLSFHQERCDDTPKDRKSLSCRDTFYLLFWMVAVPGKSSDIKLGASGAKVSLLFNYPMPTCSLSLPLKDPPDPSKGSWQRCSSRPRAMCTAGTEGTKKAKTTKFSKQIQNQHEVRWTLEHSHQHHIT